MSGKLFTAKQVAALCGMTKDGIHKARRRSKFPNTKRVEQLDGSIEYHFTRHDVREFLLFEHDISLEEVE